MRMFSLSLPVLCTLAVLASLVWVSGLTSARLVYAAAESDDQELTLTLSGALLNEVTLETPVSLRQLARTLALLSQTPLPEATQLPVQPELEDARWASPSSVTVNVFTDIEAAPGYTLQTLQAHLRNHDTRAHTLPQRHQHGLMAGFDEDILPLTVWGLDGEGRQFPTVAVLCGENTQLLPGAVRPCTFVWELPADLTLQAVVVEVPARLQLAVETE